MELLLFLLLIAILAFLIFFFLQWTKTNKNNPERITTLEQQVASLQEQHQGKSKEVQELAQQNVELQERISQQSSRIKELESNSALEENQKLRKELESFNHQLSTEKYSRHAILSSCKEAGLHGVLFTNLTFTGTDGVRRQIDHLIISNHLVLVIENKYWSGEIWHLNLPLGKHSGFKETFIHHRLTSEGQKTNIYFEEQTDSYAVSPGKQARKQAMGLKKYLESENQECATFIETAVLFSHPNASYWKADFVAANQSTGYLTLHNSAAGKSLKDFLLSMTSAKKHKVVNIEELHRALQPLALVNDRF